MTENSEVFIQFIEDIVDESGKNRTAGTIYANLILEKDDLTQQDLQERLGLSNATISRCITVLEEKGKIIAKQRIPGTRILKYSLPDDSFGKLTSYPLKQLYIQYDSYISRLGLFLSDIDPKNEKFLYITVKSLQDQFEKSKQAILSAINFLK